ncbi:MAG: carbohydrate kinase family protein [Oscillospiraceae bacterium]|nr:carbohydrate kinase family protein [Oscillospiraceae bacterium]
MSLDIIGLGDTNVDLMIRVDHLPQHDEKVRGKLVGRFAGGIIGNFCCAASTAGARVGAVCKVGTDDFGRICLDDFTRRGVDISRMVIDSGAETYFCIVHLDGSGEKALTIVETSGLLPRFEEVDLDYLKTAQYVHTTTLGMELVDPVAAALKGSGVQVSLDIEATASKVPLAVWKRVLGNTAIAIPNQAGLAALTGEEDEARGAKILLDWGAEMVVVTCGAKGVKVFMGDDRFEHPAYPVTVVDTTGAGDCFNGFFLSCLSKQIPLEQAVKYASAAAAISIGQVGARAALPTMEQVEQFIWEREG